MIAKDILLPNTHKIPSGIITTLQSIIFDSVMGSSERNKKKERKGKKEGKKGKKKRKRKK